MSETLNIEVAYAVPGAQRILAIGVPEGCSAREAAVLSRMDRLFPEIDTARCPLGVFGAEVSDDYRMRPGDRLEIYRPLENDPLETRRRNAG